MDNDIFDYAIVGGGPTGMTLAWLLASHDKNVVLIEKENVLGGCHRVQRVDGYFTEHGPRIYSNSYLMFKEILADMNISFDDLFVEYKFKISNIDNKTVLNLSISEKSALVYAFIYLIFNDEYGKDTSMKEFMLENKFTASAIDYIERLCRLTDGASTEDYTLFQFLQLLNQQFLYKLYQPKLPNDRGLLSLWEKKLREKGVKIYLESTVSKLNKKHDKIESMVLIKNGQQINLKADKYILTLPPKPLYNLISSSDEIKNAFGDIDKLKEWKSKNSYFDYIPLTFHYTKETEIPKVNGFPRTPWGIGFIIISDFMNFKNDPSKTVISICISMTDVRNEEGKTANECSKEEIIEYVKKQLNFFPNPDKVIISPNVIRSGDKWINIDTAFVVTNKNRFIDYKSNIDNLYSVGIHNGNSFYHFTSIESAVQNSINFVNEEIPELKYRYKIKRLNEVTNIIFDLIILLVLIFLLIKIKEYMNKK